MAIHEERISGRTVERVTTGNGNNGHRPTVLDQVGGPLDQYVFAEADRTPASLLIALCRCACGSMDQDGGHFDFVPPRFGWRTLREVSPEVLAYANRRVERQHPGWRLPGTDADPIHDRIEQFFASARR